MSLIDFYCSGPSAESLKKWDNARSDTYKMTIETGFFGGESDVSKTNPRTNKVPSHERIKPVKETDKNVEWIVDGAIKVTTAHSDLQRQEIIDFWNCTHTLTLVSGIVGTLLGVVSGVGTFFVAAKWLKVTCIVASIALLVFAFISFWRNTDASDQREVWEKTHPTVTVANKRLEVLAGGFAYLNKNSASFLTKSEISYLQKQAFDSYHEKLEKAEQGDSTAKSTFVSSFLDSSLLSPDTTEIALGKGPHKLTPYCEQFKTLHPSSYFSTQQSLLDKKKDALIQDLNAQYYKDAAAINAPFEKKVKKWDQERDKKLEKLKPEERANSEHPKVKAIVAERDKLFTDANAARKAEIDALAQPYHTEKGFITEAHAQLSQMLRNDQKKGNEAFYIQTRDIFRGAYAALNNSSIPKPIYVPKEAQMESYVQALREQAQKQKKAV